MNKYFVIATKWDDDYEKQIKYVAGQFDSFINAAIFKNAYNDHYKTDAQILDQETLFNAKGV